MTGSSLGGGLVRVFDVDGFEVRITGAMPTLVVRNVDTPGVVARVARILADDEVNIAYHLLAFLLPRRRGQVAPAWALLVRLLVPGSLGFSGGLGLALLLLFAFGLLRALQGQGVGLLLLAYGLHLLSLLFALAPLRR